MSKDYYALLGVSSTASPDEIKKAFRKKAKEYHPDVAKDKTNAEAKFKEVNEAYEILGDKQKRASYDQFGSAGAGAGFGGAGFDPFSGQGGFDFGGGFSDIFENFFGGQGGSRSTRRKQGRDMQTDIEITLADASTGVHKDIDILKIDRCDKCDGAGGTGKKTCDTCHGRGQINQMQNTILGRIQTTATCPTCRGDGSSFEKPCDSCHATGQAEKKTTIKVKIPSGVDTGSELRLSGNGEAGLNGAPYGDLYIRIHVKTDPKLARKGNTLFSDIHISVIDAVLGTEVKIYTLYGDILLKIPAGTQSSKVFKLSGYGMSRINSDEKGDQLVTVNVDIPKKLNAKEKKIYEELAEISGKKKNGNKGWF